MENLFKIIALHEAHIPYIKDVIKRRLWECDPDDEIRRWMDANNDSQAFIGLLGDKPIAVGVFDIINDEVDENINSWNILLFVEPEYRGNNYGWLMSLKRFEWARSRGYKEVYLDTHTAKEYHQKHGWEYVRDFEDRYGKGVIMKYSIAN